VDLSGIVTGPDLAGTRWSIEVRVDDSVVAVHEPLRLVRTASLGKLFLLVEIADRIERGELDPAHPVRRDRALPVADSGLWQHLSTAELPVVDVACLVGAVSDNWATNALLGLVGIETVQRRARSLAPGGSTLHDLVRDHRGPDHPPTLSEGCAADHAALMAGLAAGTVVTPDVSARVLAWLGTGTDLSMVAAALLLDPLAHGAPGEQPDRGLRLWNKTGTDSRVRADVGVVAGPVATATYAVLCSWDRGDDRPRRPVMAAMREIGAELAALVGAPGTSLGPVGG